MNKTVFILGYLNKESNLKDYFNSKKIKQAIKKYTDRYSLDNTNTYFPSENTFLSSTNEISTYEDFKKLLDTYTISSIFNSGLRSNTEVPTEIYINPNKFKK